MKKVFLFATVLLITAVSGCARYGPEPETVPYVDIQRYVGVWHEIASNPVFFNRGLVGVTAEYAVLNENQISVLNSGYEGSIDEANKTSITGVATVNDTETNSKLTVQFDMLFGALTKGKYWIVLLDEENYEYAVVTDNRQFTLFVLSRTPEMDKDLYDRILASLEAKQVDTSRLKVTGTLNYGGQDL